jgi:transcription elongation factor GreA
MVESAQRSPTLGEAAGLFLATLPPQEKEVSQPEVYKFVRWYGWDLPLQELRAPEVANYAERLALSDTDYAKKLEPVRAFLAYAKRMGWSRTNLAVHLKAKKAKAGAQTPARQGLPEAISLTQRGYAELEAELAALKRRRPELVEEISRAAADKDFSENAPLAAAKEQLGHLEGRIRELEEILKTAKIIDEAPRSDLKSDIGDRIIVCDLSSGEELRYMIVDPKEVDPTQGKISCASPLGRALIGRSEGDIVEVSVPAGKLRYQVKRVEH